MTLKEPALMDECIYFTQRYLGAKQEGHVKCWVIKENCPKCQKSLMGKPKDPKTGKVKIRATEYQCPSCNYTLQKDEYEETLTANVKYTCPYCKHQGEIQLPFKRKKVKLSNEELQKETTADALRFQCEKCKKNIDITKKMK